MKVAVSASNPDFQALIQARFEDSQGVLIVETDTMEITAYVTENIADSIVSADCEMLLCGEIRDAVFFDKIAEYGVTRCLAAGLSVRDAIEKGIPLSFDITFARLIDVSDALKLKESFATSLAWQCVSPVKPLASLKQNSI